MPELLRRFFSSDEFMPHGHCYFWRPEVVWLHVLSDASIALAYVSIPVTLAYFVRRRVDLPFPRVFVLFSLFIVLCGATHAMEVWTLWNPTYWFSGSLKALTAVVSLATAGLLVKVVPVALSLPAPEQLRKMNAQLQLHDVVVRNMAAGICLVRASDATIVYANPRFTRILGYADGELDGQPAHVLNTNQDGESARDVAARLVRMLRDWGHSTYEVTNRRKDGTMITCRATASTFEHPEHGTVFVAVQEDISEQRKKEAEIQSSEARFRNLLEAAPDAMVISNSAGVITLVNSAAEHLFGRPRDALIGQAIESLVPERFRQAHGLHRLDYLRDPRRRGMGASLELVALRGDGSEVPVEISLSPLQTEEGVLVSAAIRDATPRRRTEEALSRLAVIVESSDDAIYSRTPDGNIRTWNKGAERLFGYDQAEIIGRPVSLLGGRDPAADFDGGSKTACVSVDHVETIRRHKDGRMVEVSLATSAIVDGRGTVIGAATIARDISATKQAERAIRASLQEKEVLLKEVHHRVKNNLQVISSLLKLHAEKVSDPDAREAFRGSQEQVRSIALLHENMYRSNDLGRVDLGEYAHTLIDTLIRSHDQRRVKHRIEAENIYLGVDRAVPCGLVLNELVTNALKHAFAGSTPDPEVRVSVRRVGRYLELTISDNGVGLPAAFGLTEAQSLGMHLVRTLSRQLDGNITFETNPGGGTACVMRFPEHPEEE